jgi:predicted negative regulator of RcsB-dependent stress response
MAALSAARAGFESGDLDAAKAQLQWVIDNAKEDEMRDVARMRLAGVLLDEKKYDDALALANAGQSAAFSGLYADLKGDILLAQGKRGEARGAYQQRWTRVTREASTDRRSKPNSTRSVTQNEVGRYAPRCRFAAPRRAPCGLSNRNEHL